jgi:hypothetical protein
MPVEYTSFQDTDLTLPKPSGDIDKDVEFTTPNVDTTKNAVLSFEANPTDGNPTLELSLNGHKIYTRTYFASVERVVQENFPQSILLPTNTLSIRVTGDGSVTTSDYHVIYKSN